jgi:hypothetical protein
MSDNHRRYRAIKSALQQMYFQEVKGRQAQQLTVLAMLINGIVGSQRSQLPAIASKSPDGQQRESRIKRFQRWLKNEDITYTKYFMPFAQAVLAGLSQQPLVLVIDGSEIGRGCLCLMVSVIYQTRALPLGWLVIKGQKGHFSAECHTQVLAQIHALLPPEADVILLGDGEFDSVALQTTLRDYGWHYVCRTAKNVLICEGETWFSWDDLWLQPGECVAIPDVGFTAANFAPVLVIAWWEVGYQHPIFLVTNLDLPEEACHWYRRRFRIETFFSDQKSRGFHLHKSHLHDPERLARLLLACCLAYLWIVYLGVLAKNDLWLPRIHRTHRCDLSLFQLGFALLDHCLNESLPIPVTFHLSFDPLLKSVR